MMHRDEVAPHGGAMRAGVQDVLEAKSSLSWEEVLFGCAAVHYIFYLFWTLGQPSVDMWGFRPAQTIISVPYILREGAWFANIVPILGEPWRWPLEFPLFQWLVAILYTFSPFSVDASARIVSSGFGLAVVWPLAKLSDSFGLSRRAWLIAGALWLLAPVVIFWGRVPLIETSVVFLGMGWLAFYVDYLRKLRWIHLGAATAFGAVAAAVKVTAFVPFVVIGFVFTCTEIWRRRHSLVHHLQHFALAGTSVAIAVAAFLAWSQWTDQFIQANPLARQLRFENLMGWYLGKWEDRWTWALWDWALRQRALPEAIGILWLVAVYAAARMGRTSSVLAIVIILVLTYIVSFLLFPRLHLVHPYYQVENAVLLTMAVAVAADALFQRGRSLEGGSIVGAIVIGQLWTFYAVYFPHLKGDLNNHPYYKAGSLVKLATPENSIVVVFGAGYGADVPYFSDRRGIVLANWFGTPAVREVLFSDRAKWLGGREIGAVVDCRVFENQRIDDKLVPVRDELKKEFAPNFVRVSGSVFGANVANPSCDVFLKLH